MNRARVLRLDVVLPKTIDQRGRSVPHHAAASGGGRWYLTGVFFATFALIAGSLFGIWFFSLLVAYIMVP